jgi:hypothetical protein
MRSPNEEPEPSGWSMAGDACPACGGFDTHVGNSEGLTVHSLKPGSRYRRGLVVGSPCTLMICRSCEHRQEHRGFPDRESLRGRAGLTSRSSRPRPPRRLG